jgi:ABC-type taurine transport system ATPase subunit
MSISRARYVSYKNVQSACSVCGKHLASTTPTGRQVAVVLNEALLPTKPVQSNQRASLKCNVFNHIKRAVIEHDVLVLAQLSVSQRMTQTHKGIKPAMSHSKN